MSTSQILPLYQCHKQVRAVKIKEVLKHAHSDPKSDDAEFESSSEFQGAILIPADARFLPIAVDAAWYRKNAPQPGGYYVVYEDGYTSYSPASAFEKGYSTVIEVEQLLGRVPSAAAMVNASASISGQQKRFTHREELARALVSGAACQIALNPSLAGAIAKGIKTALDELAPIKGQGPQIATTIPTAAFRADPEKFGVVAIAAFPVINPGPDSLEREIQAKANKGPRVTPAALQTEIVSTHYFTAADGVLGAYRAGGDVHPVGGTPSQAAHQSLGLLTICVLILRNGFSVHGVSACASPDNFNAEIGRRIARENAEREIWPLLGFRLRDELARPVLTDADAAADLAGTPRPT